MLFLEPRKQFDAKSYVKFNKRSYRVGGFGMFFGSRGIWMLAVSGRAKTLKIVQVRWIWDAFLEPRKQFYANSYVKCFGKFPGTSEKRPQDVRKRTSKHPKHPKHPNILATRAFRPEPWTFCCSGRLTCTQLRAQRAIYQRKRRTKRLQVRWILDVSGRKKHEKIVQVRWILDAFLEPRNETWLQVRWILDVFGRKKH